MNFQLPLIANENDSRAGFRLSMLEVYNWGTFHEKIWTLTPEGQNVLVTGDIGSGKSTLVDAITTLLVPANRISYNKAAGAEARERTLRSYVQGYYKSTRAEEGHNAKPVALRDNNCYSVILGVFRNEDYGQTVTLAQVFWQKDLAGQPERFFIVADTGLSIAKHFAHFGSDIKNLKKSLKSDGAINVYDSFPPYSAAFRRRFGIVNDQALELFLQTVSLKSVGNLTDFVRTHMLEASDIKPRIDALITHFDNLTRAHNAVLKAKQQVQRLGPLVQDLDRHREISELCEKFRKFRDHLRAYFSNIKAGLLEQRLAKLKEEYSKFLARISQLHSQYSGLQSERDKLRQAIAENGGDRLERLKADIHSLSEKKNERLSRYKDYCALAEILSLPSADTLDSFMNNRKFIRERLDLFEREEADLLNLLTEAKVEFKSIRDKHNSLTHEIESLKQRKNNIDSRQLEIRSQLVSALAISETELPFAGELIQVRPEESVWEGAIERLLHNFGLSLLVPERHYAAVSDWVDKTFLRGRIVYYKIPSGYPRENITLQPGSVFSKLSINPGTDFQDWIEQEMIKRFDYVCCTDMTQFRREKQAITASGQIKGLGYRHEKDDRHDIFDKSRYILGWSNEAKISALKDRLEIIERDAQETAQKITGLQEKQKNLSIEKVNFVKIDGITKYEDMDFYHLTLEIDDLEKQKKEFESTSNVLKTLEDQLSNLDVKLKSLGEALDSEKGLKSKNEQKQETAENQLLECSAIIQSNTSPLDSQILDQLDSLRHEALGEQNLTVESCDNRQQEMREGLQKKIDNEDKRLKGLEEKIVKNMQDYRRDYPADTLEADARVEDGSEYRKMLTKLENDALPQFEKRFKELLNEETIREIANFQSQLNKERQLIKERIESINISLREIEYNKGRYIVLEVEPNREHDIADFQGDMRSCTEGSLTGSEDEQYAESKFIQVKKIIDRFRGREGTGELDKRWTQKVTDVRNWFVFAASERWLADNKEYEHYTDSGGKSGGQKEKLAYTVLAASLAYQFGLEWGEVKSRSFRFVVIDEAFGRGSDESARFGLELFKKLNLQILVVTPLQKIHIIEPYVSSVGFVHCPDGNESKIRNLTIEEYKNEKKQRENEQ